MCVLDAEKIFSTAVDVSMLDVSLSPSQMILDINLYRPRMQA